jgi:hypothetical protein
MRWLLLTAAIIENSLFLESDPPVEYAPEEAASVVLGLDAGLKQLQEGAAFHSTFTVEWGECSKFEIGSASQTTFIEPSKALKVRGQLHKSGSLIRCQFDFVDGGWEPVTTLPSDFKPTKEGLRHFRHVPADEATNGTMQASYTAKHVLDNSTFGNEITVDTRKPELQGAFITRPLLWIDPLALGKRSVHQLFELGPDSAGSSQTRQRVLKRTDGRLEVILEKGTGEDAEQKRLVFQMAAPAAVLEHRIERTVNVAAIVERDVEFKDFQKCAGGLVAREVVERTHTKLKGAQRDLYSMSRWFSKDLGAIAPTPKDFVIEVPESTRVIGTSKIPASVNGVRKFDITQFAEKDLLFAEGRQNVDSNESRPPRRTWLLVLAINGVALCALLAIFAVRRRFGKGLWLLLLGLSLVTSGCNRAASGHIRGDDMVISADVGPLFPGATGLLVEHVFSFRNPSNSQSLVLSEGVKSCTCLNYDVLTPRVGPNLDGKVRLQVHLPAMGESRVAAAAFSTNLPDCPKLHFRLNCKAYPALSYRAGTTSILTVRPGATEERAFTIVSNQSATQPEGVCPLHSHPMRRRMWTCQS